MRSLETQMTGTEESQRNTQQRDQSQRRADQEDERRLSARVANLRDKLAEQRGLRDVREARFKRDLEIQGNDIEITEREIGFKKTQYIVAKELADRLERYYKDGIDLLARVQQPQAGRHRKLEVERQQLERSLESSKLKLSQMRSEHQTWEIDWKLSVASMQTELTETQAALAGLRQTSGARAAEERETVRRLTEDAAKTRIRVAALRDELDTTRGAELTIGAPCAGTVLRLAINAPGAVVQEGEMLAEMACAGEALQAR